MAEGEAVVVSLREDSLMITEGDVRSPGWE